MSTLSHLSRHPVEVARGEADRTDLWDAARLTAIGCALLAAAIHLYVVPAHLDHGWLFGAFFGGLGLAQLGLAAALARPLGPRILTGAIAVHLAVVALYVATRTRDLPFLPPEDVGHAVKHLPVAGGVGNGIPIYPGTRQEPVGALDLVCLVAELLLIGLLAGMLPARWRRLATSAMVGLAAVGLAARVVGVIG